MGRGRRLAVGARTCVACALVVGTLPRAAWSDPKPLTETLQGEALQDFEQGALAYKNKDYASAIVKLRRAYDLSKDPRILWNMALCEQQLRHYAESTRLFRRYLAEGAAVVTDKDREDANKKITEMEPFTATLHFVVDQTDAEIVVDDADVGKSPFDAAGLLVDIGSHKITVKKAGFHDATQTVLVDGSKRDVPVTVQMQPEVHQGEVEIHVSIADAEIFIDGKLVGKGSWAGVLPSRGHTLHVTAPGMQVYDRELLVSDGDHRTLDVPLEPQVVVEEPYDAGDLALRLGAGSAFRDSQGNNTAFYTVGADIGVRLGRPTVLGLGLEYGTISPTSGSGTCGFQIQSGGDNNVDPATGDRFYLTSCRFFSPSIFLAVHTAPRSRVDFWFDVHVRGILSVLSVQRFDVASNGFVSDKLDGGATQAGAKLGLDVRPLDTYRAFSVGPYLQFDVTIFGGAGKSGNLSSPSGTHPLSGLLLGLRTAITF